MLYPIYLIVFALLDALELYHFDEQYDQYPGAEATDGFLGLMSSNDLILVVLGVSLIIWFTLLAFLIKLDRKVSSLEQKTESEPHMD